MVAVQVRAVFQAAAAAKQAGADAQPEIMVPLVATVAELRNQIALIHEVAKDCAVDLNVSVEYRVGTMIETPRSALIAQQLAKDVDFFSFGTNDLTQMAYGLSRDDIGHFLPTYMREKILPADPFQVRLCRHPDMCSNARTPARLQKRSVLLQCLLVACVRPSLLLASKMQLNTH